MISNTDEIIANWDDHWDQQTTKDWYIRWNIPVKLLLISPPTLHCEDVWLDSEDMYREFMDSVMRAAKELGWELT